MTDKYSLKQKLHRLKEKGHITYGEYMELKRSVEHRKIVHIKPASDVLVKIRDEIIDLIAFNTDGDYISEAGQGMQDCLDIINKYIKEK